MEIKVLEISESGSAISLERGFLVYEKDKEKKRIPLDHISYLIFSGYGQFVSTKLLNKLLELGVGVSFCGNNFMPQSYLMPYQPVGEYLKRFQAQLNMSLPLKKNLWAEIVRHKIIQQGKTLEVCVKDNLGLIDFARGVRSGDPDNKESQAARKYFSKLFGEEFKRGDVNHPFNALLNYGYMVLRSVVARNIVKSGLNPLLALHHKNERNAFPLVDDLVEPFRGVLDFWIWNYIQKNGQDIEKIKVSPFFKKDLFSLLNHRFLCDGEMNRFEHIIFLYIQKYLDSVLNKKNLLKDFKVQYS